MVPNLLPANAVASDGAVLMERLLSKKEVAHLLGISTRSVDYLVTSGQLPRVLIGRVPSAKRGAVRFRPSDLRAYTAAQVQDLGTG